MGRKPIDFTPYQDQITAWFREGQTTQHMISEFERQFKWKPALRTFNRTLHDWGLQKQKHLEADDISDELKEEIQVLFCQYNSTDKKMCDQLLQKGFDISRWQLQSIRMKLGLKRRPRTDEEKRQQFNEMRAALQKEYTESGRLGELGRRYVHESLRDSKGRNFPRDQLFEIFREFFPSAVHRRTTQSRREKGEFIVYGPNQVWCVDGHDKLSRWGFHMYGAIDGYSRFMTWLHVGYRGSTAISTLIQFIRVVRQLGFVPRCFRADRGKELPLLSAAYWALVRASHLNKDGSLVEFGDCFWYGRSMDNTRIERWWGQLLMSCTGRWKSLFERMEHHRFWIKHDFASEIALLAVYMPIIRKEVAIFVERWNNHIIRPQRNRANNVRGRPIDNYFCPNLDLVSQWGLEVNIELLAEIELVLADINIDEYLPAETLAWCEAFLTSPAIGLDRTKEDDHDWPFVQAYNHLRTALQIEHDNGNPHELSLSQGPPAGGLAELQERLVRIRGFPDMEDIEDAIQQADNQGGPEAVFNFDNALADEDPEELMRRLGNNEDLGGEFEGDEEEEDHEE
ncbi:hypothetical protein F4781DRAFT_442029 [Annulohypoxylon bovei var. microspora]|nr:hypothetical protein F4781DRAFT_442029 [Annulohypoxylon bovei var. microspora]